MGKRQRDLLEAARHLATGHLSRHRVFAPQWEQLTVLLAGSAVAPYADRYSGIDLIFLGPGEVVAEVRRRLEEEGLPPAGDGFVEIGAGGRKVKLAVEPLEEARRRLQDHDDFALLTYPQAPVVHDPQGRYDALVAGVGGYPPHVLAAKLADRYRRLRRRRASIAWNIRRAQPFVLLGNLTQLLDHALSICFYLEGRPPVGRKWLLQEGLRTPAGRTLRPVLFELFSSLGELATLGGTLNTRRNRIYQLVSRIQEILEAALASGGYDGAVREGRGQETGVPEEEGAGDDRQQAPVETGAGAG